AVTDLLERFGADLVAEVAGVPLGNQGHQPMGQLARWRLVDVFGARNEGDACLFKRNGDHEVIEPVPGKAIDFVDDQVLNRLCLNELEHGLELGPVRASGAFAAVDELLDKDSTEGLNLAFARLSLSGDRVSLGLAAPLGLFLGRDAQVTDGAERA